MARRGRLTYQRLITSLERHYGALFTQLPELKDAGRVQNLQQAINVALNTARAGMSGALVSSPAQIKQELKTQIANIHAQYDAVYQASVQAHDGAQISAFTLSASFSNHESSLPSTQQTLAPKRARGARDSSKENAVPPAAPVPQPATRKVSAVRKTPITKCAISKPTTNAGIKKRPVRNTSSKASTQNLIATPLPAPDDAQLAAAGALIELNRSPEISFTTLTSSTSSSSFITPSASGKKRTYSVYEDDTSSPYLPRSQEHASSSPAPKRCMLAPYAPVPELARGLSVSEAFALGVEYVVQHFASLDGYEGEGMRAWVEGQLTLQTPLPSRVSLDMGASGTGGDMATGSGNVNVSQSAVGASSRGFWNVV
ncbi:hypothetical protein E8E11_000197 [Didymella keratinophila]|nr:hypothetical protein E8E11_000197 [Didymella keratinophila]